MADQYDDNQMNSGNTVSNFMEFHCCSKFQIIECHDSSSDFRLDDYRAYGCTNVDRIGGDGFDTPSIPLHPVSNAYPILRVHKSRSIWVESSSVHAAAIRFEGVIDIETPSWQIRGTAERTSC